MDYQSIISGNKYIEKLGELDELNYGLSLHINENTDAASLELSLETDYKAENMTVVKKTYEEIRECLKPGYHIGVISTGTHTRDYVNYHKISTDGDWHEEPVMYVYECPGNNSDCSFAYDMEPDGPKRLQFLKDSDNIESHLCKYLWHIAKDIKEKDSGKFEYFEDKQYGRFMQSLIKEFKLANFYTTNIFKYEIFEEKSGKESALNLPQIREQVFSNKTWEDVRPAEYLNAFAEELRIFSPKVILATSNPFNIMWYWKRNAIEGTGCGNPEIDAVLKNAVLVKVPHPASRDNKSGRYLKNAINVTMGLEKGRVIDSAFAEVKLKEAYKHYTEIEDNSNYIY